MKYIKHFENYILDHSLDLNYYKITNLNDYLPFPNELYHIYAHHCKLIELPELPFGLKSIAIQNNNLTELPELPSTLKALYCSDNFLTKLPELPNTLLNLSCDNNYNLTELPKLPETLEELSFSNCALTIFPNIPNNVSRLFCNLNNWSTPIPYYIFEKYELYIWDIYSYEQRKKFESYEYQKEFLTETPEKYKELGPFGYNEKIKEEFNWLFNAIDMGLI